uniref:Uncharacterized protein n=1 Tax=Arundo donax TaxID=35708 RepID=A0A0A8Y286_ARUDO
MLLPPTLNSSPPARVPVFFSFT